MSSGEVSLNGTVDNRNSKRRAEDIIEYVSGVSNIQNNLRVGQPMSTGSSTLKNSTVESSNKNKDSHF